MQDRCAAAVAADNPRASIIVVQPDGEWMHVRLVFPDGSVEQFDVWYAGPVFGWLRA